MSWMNTRELETPALLVDLDSMEANIARIATILRDRPAKFRPHFKSHQVVCLASKQIEAGAIGITCARLEHTELLVHHGIKKILTAKQIVAKRRSSVS